MTISFRFNILIVLCLIGTSFVVDSIWAKEKLPSIAHWKKGKSFVKELDQGIGLLRSQISLRKILHEISVDHQISVFIDPRIDPSQKISVTLQNISLERGLNQIAKRVQANTKRIGNSIVVLPDKSAEIVRTLIAMKSGTDLKRLSYSWNDLASTKELLEQFSILYSIKIENLDIIPHDLWAAGQFPNATAVETLSLILLPFDLSFEWNSQRNSVRLAPLPETIAITRRVSTRKQTQSKAQEMILKEFPKNLSIKRFGKRTLEVTATLEQIEQIEQILAGKSLQNGVGVRKYVPLARRRFDLKVDRKPVLQLLQSLTQAGISLEYEEVVLRKNGISLDKLLSFELADATIDQLMTSICDPVQIKFRIAGETISLSAK